MSRQSVMVNISCNNKNNPYICLIIKLNIIYHICVMCTPGLTHIVSINMYQLTPKANNWLIKTFHFIAELFKDYKKINDNWNMSILKIFDLNAKWQNYELNRNPFNNSVDPTKSGLNCYTRHPHSLWAVVCLPNSSKKSTNVYRRRRLKATKNIYLLHMSIKELLCVLTNY